MSTVITVGVKLEDDRLFGCVFKLSKLQLLMCPVTKLKKEVWRRFEEFKEQFEAFKKIEGNT